MPFKKAGHATCAQHGKISNSEDVVPNLEGIRVACIATEGVEQPELTEPVKALREAGATVDLISPKGEDIQAFQHHDKGDVIPSDRALEEVKADEYDAVLLPGGALNADVIRAMPENQQFLKAMYNAGKPFAAICHAPWELVSAKIFPGATMTSWPSIQDDLKNAGFQWVDEEVCVDGNLVTSRKPDDIPAFNREMIKAFGRVPATAAG
jgi:protease I